MIIIVKPMACEHIVIYNSQPNFLSPYLTKTSWVCLYDGCFKIKKQMSRQQLVAYGEKMQSPHRVMINCQSLEIFCTICNKEIYDDLQQPTSKNSRSSEGSNSKNKKIKKINPYNLRQYLVISNQSEIVFAGNSQYPPSFQKEKKGLCGLKANAINSYLNSVIHLLAYVPAMAEFSRRVDLSKIDNKIIGYTLEGIQTIWSGKYRIYSIHELQGKTMTEHPNFMSYSHKTPQNMLYLILKCMLEQFYFEELSCNFGSTLTEPYDEWSSKPKVYSVMKQMFGGQCILEKLCTNCGNIKITTNRFQCLRVNYQSAHYHEASFKDFLLGLIESALNWKNSHQAYAQKIQGGTLLCEKCQQKITDFSSYVNLPNNLILQFGEDINGLNICPPDELDLYKFTIQAVKDQSKGEATYDYIGCISRDNKRYITHVKNHLNNKQLVFSDQNILQKERPHTNVKIAIYKRRQHNKYQHLVKNIRSCMEVNINPIVPLPDFWNIYLKEHHEVPALVNPFICSHGKLKPNLNLSKMRKGPQRIPIEVYRYLLEIFGGREISIEQEEDICRECQLRIDSINQIKSSEKQMAAFADKLSNKKVWLYIRRQWLDKWKQFVYADNQSGYKILGYVRPGPIDNLHKPEVDLQLSHKRISPEVWYFLHKFYGGGPRISQKDYKPNVVVKTSVNLRFQSLKEQFKTLDILPKDQNAEYSSAHTDKIEQLAEEHEENELKDQ